MQFSASSARKQDLIPCAKLCSVWAFDADLVKIFFPLQQFRANQTASKSTLCQNHIFTKIKALPKSHLCQNQSFAKIKALPKSKAANPSHECEAAAIANGAERRSLLCCSTLSRTSPPADRSVGVGDGDIWATNRCQRGDRVNHELRLAHTRARRTGHT